MRTIAFALSAVGSLGSTALAELKTQTIEYKQGDTTLVGFLAYDDAIATEKSPQPGVIVCPEWWGNNDYAHHRAEMLAKLGYVAFAVDMYGKDDKTGKAKVTTDPKVAGEWSSAVFKDNKMLRDRVSAGYSTLASQKMVDKSRIASIGYCMGGTVSLELARTGADLKAVVAFHASHIAADKPEDNKNIKATVLICYGQEDGFVPPGEYDRFKTQMKESKIDNELIGYAGAVHSFTNKDADSFNMIGVAYNKKADMRSWEHMQGLFSEVFGGSPKRSAAVVDVKTDKK